MLQISILETQPEPFHALCGGAMGKAVRYHITLGFFLQRVISDGIGGIDGLFNIAFLQIPSAVDIVCKDASKIIRLKLQSY